MDDRRQDLALFRYSLVRGPAEPALSSRERGLLVRALAERDHLGPRGERVRVSRPTLDRWIRAYRRGGAPRPAPSATSPGPGSTGPRTARRGSTAASRPMLRTTSGRAMPCTARSWAGDAAT